MTSKDTAQKTSTSYVFFLTMIVPLLIGVTIALTSLAHAKWNENDGQLSPSPLSQGWKEGVEERPLFLSSNALSSSS